MDKKEWEKPELIKMGLDIDHCCIAQPGSGESNATGDPNEPQFTG